MTSSLSQRVIREFTRLQLVLAILLFLPAGSIRFWEARLYRGLFGGSMLFITQYFLKVDPDFVERRMQIGPGDEPSKTQQVVQLLSGVLACALFLTAGLEHRLRGSDLPASIVLVADGLLLFCMGITFRVFHANRYAAGTVRVEVNQLVVSNGPYATVRHPLYVASILGFMATPFGLGSLWALPFGILLCTVVVVRILDEERFLLEHLAEYDDYCRHVRYRLIPYLW
jgi:protein-S-isoprenylcysteine O-methyltransferase Ste14